MLGIVNLSLNSSLTSPTGPDQTKSADFVGDPGLVGPVRSGPCSGIQLLVDRRRPTLSALSIHLCRDNLITRFDDRYAVAKFSKSGVLAKVPEEVPLFLNVPKTSSIRSSVSIELRLVTDRHGHRHRAIVYRASMSGASKTVYSFSQVLSTAAHCRPIS